MTNLFGKWWLNFDAEGPDFGSNPLVWIGAASFEKRCLGSLTYSNPSLLAAALILNYHTDLRPRSLGKRLQRQFHRRLRGRLEEINRTIYVDDKLAFAYSTISLRKIIDSFTAYLKEPLGIAQYDLILDVTCLTKLHACSALLWSLNNSNVSNLWVAYSIPEDYGAPRKARHHSFYGWETVFPHPLFSPNAESFPERASTLNFGLLLGGHEADRARAALNFRSLDILDAVLALTPDDPILEDMTRAENEDILREISRKSEIGWKLHECRKFDLQGLIKLLLSRLDELRKERSIHVHFVPLGPKSHIVGTIFALLQAQPLPVTLLYSIPTAYPVPYADGIKQTYWALIKR